MPTHSSLHLIQQHRPPLNQFLSQAPLTSAILSPQQTPNAVPPQNDQQQQPKPSQWQRPKKKTKRSRNALQIQKRLEINAFCEKNPDMSTYMISKKLNVPRTTIYGVIKDKDRLKELAASGTSRGLTLERKSSVESPFRIVEELLVAWSVDLRDRGFVVTGKMITAQAFEIHRMLSGIVLEPLPACKYTSGWLQRFKERRNCLLFPVSPGRGIYTEKTPQEYSRGKEADAGMEDLTASELVKWLEDFDNELDRGIVLVLDRSTWSILQPNPEDHGEQGLIATLSERLKNIVIAKVPETHNAFHPMAAGLAREFKLLYVCFLLDLDVDVDNRAAFRDETIFVDRLRLIRHAWFSVRESTISRSFETVERSLHNWAGQHRSFFESSIRDMNTKVLLPCRPMLVDGSPRRHPLPRNRANLIDKDLSREVKNAFPGAPETVIQYYLTQEAEVGPSSFLRNKVREMQHHKDFEGCFRSDSDQARRLETPAHSTHRKPRLGEGNNATGLEKDDMLTLDIHSCRNLAPCLSESLGTSQSNLNSQGSVQIGNAVVADEMIHHNPSSTDSVGPQWTLPSSGEQQVSSTADLEHGNIISSEEYREWDDELDALGAVLCSESLTQVFRSDECDPPGCPPTARIEDITERLRNAVVLREPTQKPAYKSQERPREGLQQEEPQLQEQLAIIDFCDKNPFMTTKSIGKKFNVSKRTVHRILKDKDELKCLAKREGIVVDKKTQY
ncbi:hypothetical protein BGX34_003379 [Mortierella sp. NVP85]|nr:hypothetical protein BGX34_003379 [Mortierella sp. NVP85]